MHYLCICVRAVAFAGGQGRAAAGRGMAAAMRHGFAHICVMGIMRGFSNHAGQAIQALSARSLA